MDARPQLVRPDDLERRPGAGEQAGDPVERLRAHPQPRVLARGLAASERWAEALSLLDETGRLIKEKGYTCYLPELLRLEGSILLAMPEHRVEQAEKCFMESLELSRAQGSRAWELRTATNLAAHWAGQGRPEDARALLQPVAKHLLTRLGR